MTCLRMTPNAPRVTHRESHESVHGMACLRNKSHTLRGTRVTLLNDVHAHDSRRTESHMRRFTDSRACAWLHTY